jgi:hypothetical protein
VTANVAGQHHGGRSAQATIAPAVSQTQLTIRSSATTGRDVPAIVPVLVA